MIAKSRRLLARQKFPAGGSLRPRPSTCLANPPPTTAVDASQGPVNLLDGIATWPVRDQAGSMMCIAYAAIACLELSIARAGKTAQPQQLSAGFLYWAMRAQKRPDDDRPLQWEEGGATFHDAALALQECGYCPISLCPDTWAPWSKPTPEAIDYGRSKAASVGSCATGFRPKEAFKAPSGAELDANLNAYILEDLHNGKPVGVAFPIYVDAYGTSYWDLAGERDGTLQFPGDTGKRDSLGGHAVCIVGYQPDTRTPEKTGGGYFIFRNSASRGFAPEPEIDASGNSVTGAGDGYGRVSLVDTQRHCWDLFRLQMAE